MYRALRMHQLTMDESLSVGCVASGPLSFLPFVDDNNRFSGYSHPFPPLPSEKASISSRLGKRIQQLETMINTDFDDELS